MNSLWEAVLQRPLEQGVLTSGPDLCRVPPRPQCGEERTCTALDAVWASLARVAPSLPEALPTAWHCPLWIAQQIHGALEKQATQELQSGGKTGSAAWPGLSGPGDRMHQRRPPRIQDSLWRNQTWPELWTAWADYEPVWWEWVGVDATGTGAWVVGMRESGAWVAVEGIETAQGWMTAQVIQQPSPRLIYRALPQGPWGWTSRDKGGVQA